jgi:hypothetical protein
LHAFLEVPSHQQPLTPAALPPVPPHPPPLPPAPRASSLAPPPSCMDVARRVVARWRAFVAVPKTWPVLDKRLQEGGGEEGCLEGCPEAEADAAVAAAATQPFSASPLADVAVARRVVARWRAFVAARTPCPLLDLLERLPDLFVQEILSQLDPTDRALVAQVGRPWLAAVAGSGLPRAGKSVVVPLNFKAFCTSAKRLAWAKDNGCPWVEKTCAGFLLVHFSGQPEPFVGTALTH